MNAGVSLVAEAEIVVQIEELTDGRYVAWARFPRACNSEENLISPSDNCRSLSACFQAAHDVYFDSGYISIHIQQNRKEAS